MIIALPSENILRVNAVTQRKDSRLTSLLSNTGLIINVECGPSACVAAGSMCPKVRPARWDSMIASAHRSSNIQEMPKTLIVPKYSIVASPCQRIFPKHSCAVVPWRIIQNSIKVRSADFTGLPSARLLSPCTVFHFTYCIMYLIELDASLRGIGARPLFNRVPNWPISISSFPSQDEHS